MNKKMKRQMANTIVNLLLIALKSPNNQDHRQPPAAQSQLQQQWSVSSDRQNCSAWWLFGASACSARLSLDDLFAKCNSPYPPQQGFVRYRSHKEREQCNCGPQYPPADAKLHNEKNDGDCYQYDANRNKLMDHARRESTTQRKSQIDEIDAGWRNEKIVRWILNGWKGPGQDETNEKKKRDPCDAQDDSEPLQYGFEVLRTHIAERPS
ncbi:MAG: hypothetical protein ACTHLW_06410 [Verrucomicrobiota bacterium]